MISPEPQEEAIPPAEETTSPIEETVALTARTNAPQAPTLILTEGPDPYAKILQLQAQILQLQAQLLQAPVRPPVPSGSGPPGELQLSIHPHDPSLSPIGRMSENADSLVAVPDFPKEESPRRKRANIATISFPEHRMSLLSQNKGRIEMDAHARLQVGAVIVDGHVDVVVKALSSSALAAALKLIDALTDEEDEFSTVTWSGKRAAHSPTSSMFDMRTSTTMFDIPPNFLDPQSRAELHVDPDSSNHSNNPDASPEHTPTADPHDSEACPQPLPFTVGNQFIKAGPLNKKGSGLRSWQKRLFGLTSTSLMYFKPGESSANGGLVLTPDSYAIAINSTDKHLKGTEFIVYEGLSKESFFHLAASSEPERKEWMVAVNQQVDFIKTKTRSEVKYGELELYLWFEEICSTVHVSVLRARGLPVAAKGSTLKRLSSPYVKLSIKPEQKQKAKRKTAVAKNTQDPVWNASFDFILDSAITSQTLVLSVMNKGTGKDTVIAKVEYPLLNVSCDQTEAQQGWVSLGPQENLSDRRITYSANNEDRVSRSSLHDLPIILKKTSEDMNISTVNDQIRKSSASTMRNSATEVRASTELRPSSELRYSEGTPGAMLRTIVTTNHQKQLEESTLEEDLGDLELGLWFDEVTSTLHVRVVQGRGLVIKSPDGKPQPTNALVKLEIQPCLTRNSKRKTVIVRDNTEPVWNEHFEFIFDELVTVQTLIVRVLNIDKKLQNIGGLEIPLLNISDSSDASPAWYSLLPTTTSFVPIPVLPSSVTSSSTPPPSDSPAHSDDSSGTSHASSKSPPQKRSQRVSVAMIRKAFKSEEQKEVKDNANKVVPNPPEELETQSVDLGAIKVCVWYDAEAEKLLVEVIECIGLPPQKKSLPSPYVEVKTLPSEIAGIVYRTHRHGKTLDPVFNEKFEFPITKDKCAFRTLALSVYYASGRFGKDKVMGEALIALEDIPRSVVGATQTHPLCQASSTVFELNYLGDILFLEAGFESFLSCVTREHSTENLLFWREVQDFHLKYRDATFDQRQECMADCCEIFYKYIDSGGECEINISPSIKAQIRVELTEEKQSDDITRPCEFLAVIYDPAQTEVLDMMSKDSFARYLASKEWQQFKTFLKEENTERDIGFKVVNQIADFNQVGKNRTSVIGLRGARRSSSLAQNRRYSNNLHTRAAAVPPVAMENAFANAGFVDETLSPSTTSSSAITTSSSSSSSGCFRPTLRQAAPPPPPPLPSASVTAPVVDDIQAAASEDAAVASEDAAVASGDAAVSSKPIHVSATTSD